MDIHENSEKITFGNKIVAFLKQIGIIFLYLFLTIIFINIFRNGIKSDNLIIGNLGYTLAEIGVLIVFIIIFRKTLIPDFYDFKKNYKKYLNDNLKYYLIGLAVMIISTNLFAPFIGEANNEVVIESYSVNYPFYIIVTTLTVAPIVEELLTRTVLKDVFKNKIFYYIITSLIFGALHISNFASSEVLYIISYGSLGFAFAKIYDNSNNIWTNISYHAIHNLIAVSIMFLTGV